MRSALITMAAAAVLAGCAGNDTETRALDPVDDLVRIDEVEVVGPPASQPSAASAKMARERFELMKSLEGAWVVPDGDGTSMLEYEVTANGSAILETVFPGQPSEMLSVYTLDSGRLVMTHYCAMGNQPYMLATDGDSANVIRFECQGAGNTASHADAHMHLGVFTIGDGTLQTEWTMYSDLEPGQAHGLELVRGGM